MLSNTRYRDIEIRSPRGTTLSAKSWLTEAPLRMLMNNLDPEVAENPKELVVYGGIGRAARDWPSFDAIVAALKRLDADQTLLVQSGKPVGVFRTHADAPRVLIANSNLVPHWSSWEHFNKLDAEGLMMFGQMTAGSWIYIGSQGIVQGTYETFVEAGRRHYGGSLAGRWVLTAGLGGMGGAQPLAATLAGASSLTIECRQAGIDFRLRTRYLDKQAKDLDEALALIERHCAAKEAVSIGLLGNAAEIVPELVRRGVRPDLVTDQTSAHDPLNGYLPAGWTWDEYRERARSEPAVVTEAAKRSMAVHVKAMLDFHAAGVPVFDYGNNIRQMAQDMGLEGAFAFPGFRSGLYPAAVLPRHRAVPLGRAIGQPGRHLSHRRQGEGGDPGRPAPPPLARHGTRAHQLPGPAGPHLLGGARPACEARPRVQRDGAKRRTRSSGGDRPGPSRFRLRRVAKPRDRGDAGRLRRRERLAPAQRAIELCQRRHLGVAAPWRRRRHGLLPACRHGDRGGRHRRSGAAPRSAC